MKTSSFSFVICIVLITACAPQSVATPSSQPVITNIPLATATPQSTQTVAPTLIPVPVGDILLDSCTQIIETKISSAGALEVVYKSTDWNAGGFTKLWLWNEDAQDAVPFPMPPNVFDPKLSEDHRRIIFRRDSEESQSEIWVIDANGQNENRLATIRYDEIKARYPADFTKYAALDFDWVANTDKIFYYVGEWGEVGLRLYDKFVLVDINSGMAISLTIPSRLKKFEFAPNGNQIAVQTESELRVFSTQDGRMQFAIQASLNNPIYSPDSKYIIDTMAEGILRIDARDGQQQIIPLKYSNVDSLVSEGPFRPQPYFTWVDNSTLILPSLDPGQQYVMNPDNTFTLWQVDLIDATSHPIGIFSGLSFSHIFSPDKTRLAFYKFQGVNSSQTRDLLIADLATGEILETIDGGVFEAWSPDSDEYIYSTGHPAQKGDTDNSRNYLGVIGSEPILLDLSIEGSVWSGWWWLNRNRFVMDCRIMYIP